VVLICALYQVDVTLKQVELVCVAWDSRHTERGCQRCTFRSLLLLSDYGIKPSAF